MDNGLEETLQAYWSIIPITSILSRWLPSLCTSLVTKRKEADGIEKWARPGFNPTHPVAGDKTLCIMTTFWALCTRLKSCLAVEQVISWSSQFSIIANIYTEIPWLSIRYWLRVCSSSWLPNETWQPSTYYFILRTQDHDQIGHVHGVF